MPVEPNDLIFPAGELQPAWFVDSDDIDEIVAVWIAEETEDGVEDEAVRYRVYARAYRMIANRIAAGPISSNYSRSGGKGTRYDKAQITHWRRLAADAEEAANQAQTGTTKTAQQRSASGRIAASW